jgi:hypothetical protein
VKTIHAAVSALIVASLGLPACSSSDDSARTDATSAGGASGTTGTGGSNGGKAGTSSGTGGAGAAGKSGASGTGGATGGGAGAGGKGGSGVGGAAGSAGATAGTGGTAGKGGTGGAGASGGAGAGGTATGGAAGAGGGASGAAGSGASGAAGASGAGGNGGSGGDAGTGGAATGGSAGTGGAAGAGGTDTGGSAGTGGSGGSAATVPSCASQPCNGALVSGTGNAEPRGIFADASGVYWTNRTTGVIRRADLDGTNAADFVTGLSALGGLYGDDTYLYAPQYAGGGSVQRIRKSDLAKDVLVTIAGASLHGADFFDGAFYFTEAVAGSSNTGKIHRFVPGDASATVAASGLRDRLFTITHDATTAYLVSQGPSSGGNGGIVETTPLPIAAPLSTTTVVTGLGYPIGGHAAEGYVYVANGNAETIERFPTTGFAGEVVANCPGSQSYGVWVYSGVAYYTCPSTNEVRAVGLPLPAGETSRATGNGRSPEDRLGRSGNCYDPGVADPALDRHRVVTLSEPGHRPHPHHAALLHGRGDRVGAGEEADSGLGEGDQQRRVLHLGDDLRGHAEPVEPRIQAAAKRAIGRGNDER